MSSPSPDPQKPEHTYQPSDTSEHGLLSHGCSCTADPKTHHHHITTHLHPHVHVHAAPKTCTCHIPDDGGDNKPEADDRIEVSNLPPALPPRPPPRPRIEGVVGRGSIRSSNPGHGGIRKYVFWCCACGGMATILGALFLAVYFLLRSYTSTLGYFETIPTFVPATMLILTGLCVMSLARRKNRYSYLIKVCGLCCLVCALTCVLVTITTTVIHMNRLQTLRECVYTQKTRTCICYSVLLESRDHADDEIKFVFNSTPDCEVIHGALYSCLRAMFGLSVSGILVCIFSCMLVYQLLSHEKKKMYWEQLELRCRSFYQQQSGPPPSSAHGSVRGPPIAPTYCSCCEECRYPTMPPQVYPWDSHTDRFWTPGRVGNFYSPNPGEDGSDPPRPQSGWSWRRLPWTRNSDPPPRDAYQSGGGGSSADSQYGFGGRSAPYSVLDGGRPPAGGVYVWGPPPPYSNPNSPLRRPLPPAKYHHIHHHHEAHCQMNDERGSRRGVRHKDNYENTGEGLERNEESTDSSCGERGAHTLPVRKVKKKGDVASVKSTNQVSSGRAPIQTVFPATTSSTPPPEASYHEPKDIPRFLPRLQGVENAAFQKQESAASAAKPPEPSESEVYFADVSSCCNISVRNDQDSPTLYDEAQGGRSRLPFAPPPPPENLLLPKDISQNSLCSSVQTESTDISPSGGGYKGEFLAPDAQYDGSNLANTISGASYGGGYYKGFGGGRRNIGSNISALIQNLGVNSGGLLYGEAEAQGQACHSDGTMDSGWHSGEEKGEKSKEEPVNV